MRVHRSTVLLAALLLLPLAAMGQWPEGDAQDAGTTPFDPALDPGYELGLKQIEDSKFDDHGESSVLVFDASWAAAYFLDALFGGDVDLSFLLKMSFLSDSTDLALPDQLLKLAAELGVTWHYENGMALQVSVAPGFYSDMEAFGSDAIFFPFSLALSASLSPNLAGVIGAHVRPEFELVVLPIIGIDWDISQTLELQAQLPRSRLTWYAAGDWIFFLGLDWESESYALEKKGKVDRRMITLESLNQYMGVVYRIDDEMRIALLYGKASSRDVEFEKDAGLPRVSDIEDGQFFRLALLGPL